MKVTVEMKRRRETQPILVVVSAHRSPHTPLDPSVRTYELSDDELISVAQSRWAYPALSEHAAELLLERMPPPPLALQMDSHTYNRTHSHAHSHTHARHRRLPHTRTPRLPRTHTHAQSHACAVGLCLALQMFS